MKTKKNTSEHNVENPKDLERTTEKVLSDLKTVQMRLNDLEDRLYWIERRMGNENFGKY